MQQPNTVPVNALSGEIDDRGVSAALLRDVYKKGKLLTHVESLQHPCRGSGTSSRYLFLKCLGEIPMIFLKTREK